jgi:Exonuclease VII, large subunit
VMERLSGSGYAVRARVVPVAATGGAAAEHLAAAISAAAADADLVLLVREEGRRLGLAPFDSYPLARAIAATTVPVVTGIGAAEDHTVADEVAFEAAPTALAAADAVLARISAAEQRLRVARDDVRAQGVQALDRAGAQLAHARDEVEHTGREAERRAAGAANRRYRWVLAGAGVLALALVAVAVLAHSGWWLLGLVALVALVAGFHWQRTSYLRKGSRAMVAEVSFTEVLERLRRIRDELALTSSPEKVYRLSDEARQLVERGESVLGRPLDAVAEPLSPPSPPKVTAATADTVSIPSVPSAASSTAAVAGTEPPVTTGATADPATAPPR